MIRVLWGFVYIVGIIIFCGLIPVVMIPFLQGYGLDPRDVVGFCVVLIFLSVLLFMSFGALAWSVLS